jgi:DNA replicative helicase MCM subunit Mcm2 (Cdc46/Mcm family)
MVLRHPDVLLELCDEAVVEAQERLVEEAACMRDVEGLSVKRNVSVRFTHLPAFGEFCKPNLSCLRSCDVGGLVQVSGTVIRSGMVRAGGRGKGWWWHARVSSLSHSHSQGL